MENRVAIARIARTEGSASWKLSIGTQELTSRGIHSAIATARDNNIESLKELPSSEMPCFQPGLSVNGMLTCGKRATEANEVRFKLRSLFLSKSSADASTLGGKSAVVGRQITVSEPKSEFNLSRNSSMKMSD